jgi:hypothetical protein
MRIRYGTLAICEVGYEACVERWAGEECRIVDLNGENINRPGTLWMWRSRGCICVYLDRDEDPHLAFSNTL